MGKRLRLPLDVRVSSGLVRVTQELITVEIPGDIPECCWPNSRCHWAARAKEVAMMRDVSRLVADSYLSQNRLPVTLDAVSFVKVKWHHTLGKHKRQRDIDNTIAATKPIQDGVFDALGLDDRLVRELEVTWSRGIESSTRMTVEMTARSQGSPSRKR